MSTHLSYLSIAAKYALSKALKSENTSSTSTKHCSTMKICSSQRIGTKKDVKLLKKTFIEGKSRCERVGEDKVEYELFYAEGLKFIV